MTSPNLVGEGGMGKSLASHTHAGHNVTVQQSPIEQNIYDGSSQRAHEASATAKVATKSPTGSVGQTADRFPLRNAEINLPPTYRISGTDKTSTKHKEVSGEIVSSVPLERQQDINLEIRGNHVHAMISHDGLAKSITNGNSIKETGVAARDVGPEVEGQGKVRKLSGAKLYELSSSAKAFPLHISVPSPPSSPSPAGSQPEDTINKPMNGDTDDHIYMQDKKRIGRKRSGSAAATPSGQINNVQFPPLLQSIAQSGSRERPSIQSRSVTTPAPNGNLSSSKSHSKGQSSISQSKGCKPIPAPLEIASAKPSHQSQRQDDSQGSPAVPSLPIPPLTLPAFLHLELSSERPSPLYIHRSATSDFPYEPSQVKLERLLNFLLLPPLLEQVLWFGAFACLDAWLYTFTILPLRFLKAVYILGHSWASNIAKELIFLIRFTYSGLGRLWRRRVPSKSQIFSNNAVPVPNNTHTVSTVECSPQTQPVSQYQVNSLENLISTPAHPESNRRRSHNGNPRHRRIKSSPSTLMPSDKADLLKGLLILISCTILMYFDASMMYHSIRGQAAIKLYVIYNVLEVCDRLLSALGQDVLECLLASETLERKPDGHSKVLRPFGLFLLALIYNLVHSTALFYQVITLNVAVNSYSNALLTLLMSNQFVEIKGTVFKKIEKENLFQLTCADVVERFQLWLMLMIIASRNIVETNSLGASPISFGSAKPSSTLPVRSSSIIPKSFTVFPDWVGQVLSPFLLVLGTEMLVDWLKHAYINKFNNVKPNIYGRFLDVLAKDYYSNAFTDQNLTSRLGLPLIPLSCLFIRASVQTYHMFLATIQPSPIASTPGSTSLSASTLAYSSTPTPHPPSTLSHLFAYLPPLPFLTPSSNPWLPPDTDALLSTLTTVVFFLLLYLLLLTFKLVLGMSLLSFARARHKGMREREQISSSAGGRRLGGWGMVEVDEEKRRYIYEGDVEGLRRVEKKEKDTKDRSAGGASAADTMGKVGRDVSLEGVRRYDMVGKRIW